MNIKLRLTIVNFLQFFVWGAWLITIAVYWFGNKQWGGKEFGAVFSTLAIASIIMPPIVGIIADKWLNAEKLYGLLHICYGATLLFFSRVNSPDDFYWIMLVAMLFYMPTISLSNSISYTILKNNNYDVVKDYPPIRVWGTIGFIVAMWVTNLTGNKASINQFVIAGIAAILFGVYSFSLPKCPPKNSNANADIIDVLGLRAFKLFAEYKMLLFFLFSMCLGAALQLTNMYGDVFLSEFEKVPQYKESLVVKYSTIIMSISQISETIFIVTIPFFLKRFGIKNVMLFSMIAWVLRFGLFAYGNPADGLWMIILSCIVYGMAFDFFNISGSLFVETTTDANIRASSQGLFMMMTNGVGAWIGSKSSGYIVDSYTIDGVRNWQPIWLIFAGYALVVAVLFVVLFKHEHNPKDVAHVSH
ncbi:MAG: nucleoside permease [Chitinophagaceae bacterium]|jgi:NHS family xanthosine MFS transporter